jgi:potassium efflux system protein
LPALSRFDQWRAWDTIVEVQSPVQAMAADSPSGSVSSSATVQRVEMISVADVALSILVFAATLIATKNMPGLIELALLQRLPMDRALRFAITTVTRYLIFVVGTLWAMTNLGITWSKVQWLVAGVGVGLGFGLQEIFANFISGLIILFERKMRTGDIVTVGDVSGIVTDIRMRATTIEDWDKKELVVPNKEFITGKLLNWTLTNSMNRVVIPVSIAYGSDVVKARQIILQTALEHPEVLSDPPPSIVFDAFQESGLNLTLRAYLPTLECRLDTINDLHTAIHDALRRGKFEIPFPQREVHITMHEIAAMVAGNGKGHRQPDEAPGRTDGNWQ